MQQRGIHLGLGMAMIFLIYPKKKPENQTLRLIGLCISFVLSILSLVACFNSAFNWLDMADSMRLVFPKQSDIIFGTIVIVLVLLATKRVTGWAMPIIAIVFLLYALYGKYIPIPAFRHSGVKFNKVIAMGYMTTEGVYSSTLGVSTNQVFIFLLFGQLLDTLGGSEFFLELANCGFGRH